LARFPCRAKLTPLYNAAYVPAIFRVFPKDFAIHLIGDVESTYQNCYLVANKGLS
jgi:hypothetical protein